jgi:tetrahydromethanopterin S-methyltransferase subunit F
MRAGWANIYIGLMNSRRRPFLGINWWRVNGLAVAVVISVAVWVIAVLAALSL